MGTKVQSKSSLPGYYSMRDLNEDANSCSWPLYYGDKALMNGQYYNGFLPRAIADAYPGYDRDVVKRTMLEHEAIFKNQVYELHRLYRIQRELMDEIKKKEVNKNLAPVETSLSSSPLASQITSEDARRWHISSFPLSNSASARPSISGVEDIHSPLSSMKGNGAQVGPFPSQNGSTSKDVEVLESRPTKVRRKMFDLQLPADEYIDNEGENLKDETLSGMSSSFPNGYRKMVPASGVKLSLCDGAKTGSQGDALRSKFCFRSTNSLANLNEPIQVEETKASTYADILGHASSQGEIQSHELSGKSKSQPLELPKGISLGHHGNNGTLNSQHLENRNGRGWFSHVLEAGRHNKSSLKSVSQGLQPEKLPATSQPSNVLFNRSHEIPLFFPTDQSKVELWRERTICGIDLSERIPEISINSHSESAVGSNIPSPYPVTPSSNAVKSWSKSVSSWENPCNSLSQKSISVQHPIFSSSGTLSKSFQSAQSQGIFGDKWHLNSNFRLNPSNGSGYPSQNGFYHGSSSGSKELPICIPSVGYDYLSFRNDHNLNSEQFADLSSARVCKDSSCADIKFPNVLNSNVMISHMSSHEGIVQTGLETLDGGRKHEDHVPMLPWLREMPTSKNEATGAGRGLNTKESSFLPSSLNQLAKKNETGKCTHQIFGQNINSISCSDNVGAGNIEINDYPSNEKILGVPIFGKSHIFKNESSSPTSSSVSFSCRWEEVENSGKNRVFDMNLPCEPAVPDLGEQIAAEIVDIEKEREAKVESFRHEIDLNSCLREDEIYLTSSVPSINVKLTAGIDLEAPIVPETEEEVIRVEESFKKFHEEPIQLSLPTAEHLQDEQMRVAAEAIVSISSCNPENQSNSATCYPSEESVTDPLHWFVEIVSSCGEDLESKFDAVLRMEDSDNEESALEDMDYFESMTLKLTETKEEEYMPKPLVPENIKLEETGATILPSRPRKGQARRGRQRRDFQRDILPGLSSLSRHEVTEDLQTFGGLMRATGHLWSGLTRRNSTRNGCGRGRRRSVVGPSLAVAATTVCAPLIQQLNNIEVGLEDRSLTGWGKTTRRPRRQRCAAGNPPTVPLT
ncbi:DUF863 domain-containing protein [Cephalotus follicularis]|uniref:DUF863 domain-containing protein n=1 Tax=Cephalotus follicularis TaxID=3775 RepID=A0A1Q3C321_CEPFO|nr:DUF863 domain-containing protein [Cephalotus follicularis]